MNRYASSTPGIDCNLGPEKLTDTCDTCQPLNYIIFSWISAHQEIPSFISAFASSALVVMSVWFTVTDAEKRILRSGRSNSVKMKLSVRSEVSKVLHDQIGLSHSMF